LGGIVVLTSYTITKTIWFNEKDRYAPKIA